MKNETYFSFKNKLGDTALHAAAWKGRTEVVKLLLLNDAEVNIINSEGKTALELARDPEIIDIISKHEDTRLLNIGSADYFGSGDEQDSD